MKYKWLQWSELEVGKLYIKRHKKTGKISADTWGKDAIGRQWCWEQDRWFECFCEETHSGNEWTANHTDKCVYGTAWDYGVEVWHLFICNEEPVHNWIAPDSKHEFPSEEARSWFISGYVEGGGDYGAGSMSFSDEDGLEL